MCVCSIGKYQKDDDNMIIEINRQYFFNLNVNIIYVLFSKCIFFYFLSCPWTITTKTKSQRKNQR